jgi:hypothetical protein
MIRGTTTQTINTPLPTNFDKLTFAHCTSMSAQGVQHPHRGDKPIAPSRLERNHSPPFKLLAERSGIYSLTAFEITSQMYRFEHHGYTRSIARVNILFLGCPSCVFHPAGQGWTRRLILY